VKRQPALVVAALIAAAALLWAMPLGRAATGALFGCAVFVLLITLRANVNVKFGAFGIAGAVMFGFMTVVIAELSGLSVGQLLDTKFGDYVVANTLAIATVAFAALGVLSLVWGRVTGRYGDRET
jgi:nitrogen fixation-related uncharacterized protein